MSVCGHSLRHTEQVNHIPGLVSGRGWLRRAGNMRRSEWRRCYHDVRTRLRRTLDLEHQLRHGALSPPAMPQPRSSSHGGRSGGPNQRLGGHEVQSSRTLDEEIQPVSGDGLVLHTRPQPAAIEAPAPRGEVTEHALRALRKDLERHVGSVGYHREQAIQRAVRHPRAEDVRHVANENALPAQADAVARGRR